MTPTRHRHPGSLHHTGKASVGIVVLLLLLAVAISAVVYVALNRDDGGEPAPPPATQEEIDEQLAGLQQAFQTAMQEKQDLSRLAAQARAFTEDHPDEQGGYVLLAQTHMGMDHWNRAYDALQGALALNDQAFELCKLAGVCAAKLGQNEQALRHYQQAVAATNDQADSDVYAALGQLHLSLRDADTAEQMFHRAVKALGPGDKTNYKHKAYAGLANVASVRKQFEEALSWIDRAIKMGGLDSDADSAGYHIQKANIYLEAGRDVDAETMLSYTWSEYPETLWRIESSRLKAKLYERASKLDAAVDYLQTITESHRMAETRDDETLAQFTALLADWQIKADRIDDAKVSLHNLKTLAPKHPAIAELKAKLN